MQIVLIRKVIRCKIGSMNLCEYWNNHEEIKLDLSIFVEVGGSSIYIKLAYLIIMKELIHNLNFFFFFW